jgi:hypothetical protein
VRESAAAKSCRYLCEHRLVIESVNADLVRATCRGAGAVYDVGWTPALGWSCSCPAFGKCAHMLALQAVTVREQGPA